MAPTKRGVDQAYAGGSLEKLLVVNMLRLEILEFQILKRTGEMSNGSWRRFTRC
jgi:hypothetical protein